MAIDPYNPDPHQVEKENHEALETFAQTVAKAPQTVAETTRLLREYSENQNIPLNQALTEGILALPRRLPAKTTNLTDWIPRCLAANIPHIPITIGPKISVETLEAISEQSLPPSPHLDEIRDFIVQAYNHGEMWRWDCCGAEPLKLLAGLRRTAPEHQELPTIALQLDLRLFHILWEDQAVDVHVVSRPWTKPHMDDGFPVEFRVFKSPEGEAACNYYPQREMNAKFLPHMEEAVRLTRQLAENSDCPEAFSCDWMLTESGQVVFLEGGPPHSRQGGAHPCCFALFQTLPGRRLLKSEPGAQFFFDDQKEKAITQYKADLIGFESLCQRLKLPPKITASILAVKGIIPRELAEKTITAA